jgi:serine phosphatase RsbU (regulator of sigma subunit)
MPAALVVARLSSEARYCLVSEGGPAAAINRLNASFFRSGWEDRFVTMVLAVLDLDRHTVTIANAGHMSPLLRRTNRQIEPLGDDVTGVPLGVDQDATYEEASVTLAPGETILVFTDGISEAMDINNQLYGMERLRRQLQAETPSVKALGGRILEDVRRFVGTRAQSDDMCLLCFGRQG